MKNPLKKIVITGPESTGKSTLAQHLAERYETTFVPEFAREYLMHLNRPYTYNDLLTIAQGQIALEDKAAQSASNNLLFCDTDLYVIMVWSEHKYGKCHPWILEQLALRQYDLYFLTNIDFPWAEDPLREHPQPEMRSYFFKLYHELLIESNSPFVILNGTEEDRLNQSSAILDAKFQS